ncbi:MAG: MGDG synthase family glycosyltransferase [Acidimicrobiales bacterium]
MTIGADEVRGRILIVSASLGAGHDGAARELASRLEERGFDTEIRDFLDAAPWAGFLIKKVFAFQLRSAPWAYEATYRLWSLLPVLCAPVIRVITFVFGRCIRSWARRLGATAVVSTYPLASLVLGRDRQKGRLGVPTATFVTDFAVHPLWVHPGVDLNLCVHPQSAHQAALSTGRRSIATGPMVPERFTTRLPGRVESRRRFGIPLQAKAVLVVAGSWGVGDVAATFDALLDCPGYLPVAVCGSNSELKHRLESRGIGIVLGWTDEMPALMAASDVLIQNAGGLTCMEAFAAGLPVVTYLPIPGHGKENAVQMDSSGVAAYVTRQDELLQTLDRVTTLAGRQMTDLGQAMFAGDPSCYIAELAMAGGPAIEACSVTDINAARVRRPRRAVDAYGRRTPGISRRIGVAAAAMATLYTGFNVAADAATAHGLDVVKPADNGSQAYLAVRLGPTSLNDPNLIATMAADHVTAIVNGRLAQTDPMGVRSLATAGVSIANGGWGARNSYHLLAASTGVSRASRLIAVTSGVKCHLFAPDQAVNGFDLATAGLVHERIVRDLHEIGPTHIPLGLEAGRTYVLDGRDATSPQLVRELARVTQILATNHIAELPLTALG